jgi:hypothetical protein
LIIDFFSRKTQKNININFFWASLEVIFPENAKKIDIDINYQFFLCMAGIALRSIDIDLFRFGIIGIKYQYKSVLAIKLIAK